MNNFSNLPKSWQVKTLGEVCEILDNMQKHINATEREQRLKNANRKYAYYGATGQVGYIDEFLCDFESILLGEDGAPFLEPFKNKAYIVSGKYWVNNHAHILKAKENLATNKFVCHFLNIVDYMPYVSGTTRLKLNQSAMKQIKIPLPPLDIQKRIVARLDEVFARIDNGTKHLKSAKANLAKYKQSLLKSAFNGTLTDTLPHPKPLPQGEGLTFDSPSLADSAFSCPPPPPLWMIISRIPPPLRSVAPLFPPPLRRTISRIPPPLRSRTSLVPHPLRRGLGGGWILTTTPRIVILRLCKKPKYLKNPQIEILRSLRSLRMTIRATIEIFRFLRKLNMTIMAKLQISRKAGLSKRLVR